MTYYFTGSYLHDALGMANPTSSYWPIHDDTDQYRGFGYLSYIIDDTSRLSFILSAAHTEFQLPNRPDQVPVYQYGTLTNFDSTTLDENQTEQSYFGILAYQKTAGNLDYQLAATARYEAYPSIAYDPQGRLWIAY